VSRDAVTISPTPARSVLDVAACLRGEALYGDDFGPDEIQAWFRDEELGYFELGASDRARYRYKYHALNHRHGWRHLPDRVYPRVLGLGSAYGDELLPIAAKAQYITIMEPAEGFSVRDIGGTPVTYVRPEPDGRLPFGDGSIDLITCLGVLHHIPNVSTVVGELRRCLKPDGRILVREPIVSMGDWRHPRAGLTPRERGIPLHLFRAILARSGLRIHRETKCMFALVSRLDPLWPGPIYNSSTAVWLDDLWCRLPLWSTRYHAVNPWQKLRPTAVFYVLGAEDGRSEEAR
jgi:SAM-dependent methyltransferase